jgi:hypothetical protein
MSKKDTKKEAEKVLELGVRKVTVRDFSKTVTLPKTFIDNYLDECNSLRMTLSTSAGTLTLTPVCEEERQGDAEGTELDDGVEEINKEEESDE